MRKGICITIAICLGSVMFMACSSGNVTESASDKTMNQTQTSVTTEEQRILEGKSLFVYCGAGMTKPFSEIVDSFQNETGAIVEVTYANATQIISQITASNQGDLFVAGDQEELSTIEEKYVADTKSLVKHIPVIAVQTGNPKSIKVLKDIAREDVTVVLGDSQATPIGKISDKALTDANILDRVNVVARTTTAPEIATALSLGQCDAAIIWKENANVDGVEIVETTDMDEYIKTVPAASLKCCTNPEVLDGFLSFLNSDASKDIWESYGYQVLN